jgi:hypothetical protein
MQISAIGVKEIAPCDAEEILKHMRRKSLRNLQTRCAAFRNNCSY